MKKVKKVVKVVKQKKIKDPVITGSVLNEHLQAMHKSFMDMLSAKEDEISKDNGKFWIELNNRLEEKLKRINHLNSNISQLSAKDEELRIKIETLDNRLRHLEQMDKESEQGDRYAEGKRKLLEAKVEGLRSVPQALVDLASRIEALEKKKDDKPPVNVIVIK